MVQLENQGRKYRSHLGLGNRVLASATFLEGDLCLFSFLLVSFLPVRQQYGIGEQQNTQLPAEIERRTSDISALRRSTIRRRISLIEARCVVMAIHYNEPHGLSIDQMSKKMAEAIVPHKEKKSRLKKYLSDHRCFFHISITLHSSRHYNISD